MGEEKSEVDRHGFLLDSESCNGSCFILSEDVSSSIDTSDPTELRGYIKRGLTASERGIVWQSALNAKETKNKHRGFNYKEYVSRLHDELQISSLTDYMEIIATINAKLSDSEGNEDNESLKTIRQILMDIDRTYPNHHLFDSRSENQAKLFHILSAYSQFDADIGYCQGMAYVVGLLLMYISDEETVFWCFTYLLSSKDHLHMVYHHTLNKVKLMSELLTLLIEKNHPQLSKHLEGMGVHGLMYNVQWFMCLFTNINCWDAVLLIADLFFTEGIHHLFNAGLAVIQNCAAELMVLSTIGEALPFLQNIPYRLVHRGQLKSLLFSHPILSNVKALDKYWGIAEKRLSEEERGAREKHKRQQKRLRSPDDNDKEIASGPTLFSSGPTLFSRLANFFTPAKRQKTDESEHRGMPDTGNQTSPAPPPPLSSFKKSIKNGYYTPDTGLVYTSPNTIEMKRITDSTSRGMLTSGYSEAKKLFSDSPIVHSPLINNVLASGGERRSPRIARRRRREQQNLLNSPL